MPEPDTYAANTDTMSGILDAHGTDAHAVDTHAMYGVLFWWYSMPMPCVVSFGGDRHLCSRYHEPDTHGHDTDTMSGILDAHATDTMNQIPMAMMPISMQSIPMPCVASCSGGTRCPWP